MAAVGVKRVRESEWHALNGERRALDGVSPLHVTLLTRCTFESKCDSYANERHARGSGLHTLDGDRCALEG